MKGWKVAAVAAVAAPMLWMWPLGLTFIAVTGSTDASALLQASTCLTIDVGDPGGGTTDVTIDGLDADQIKNAGTIYSVAQQVFAKDGPDRVRRASVVGLATAMQESTLKNINYGDRDSLGLFQQRAPWGDPHERTDPPQAAMMFYTGGHGGQRGLEDIQSWWTMPVTAAAQAVQVSAFPLAYAKWEDLAAKLTAKLSGLPGNGSGGPHVSLDPCTGDQSGGAPVTLPAGAVGKMLAAAVAVEGTPYVWGGSTIPPGLDCSGLVIYAWGKAGYTLQVRTAAAMYGASDPVRPGQEQAGDLIFSEFTAKGAGHVMIVLDPARHIAVEAPHTGDVVKEIGYTSQAQPLGRLKKTVFRAGAP